MEVSPQTTYEHSWRPVCSIQWPTMVDHDRPDLQLGLWDGSPWYKDVNVVNSTTNQ
jgi:hypothetical protein